MRTLKLRLMSIARLAAVTLVCGVAALLVDVYLY